MLQTSYEAKTKDLWVFIETKDGKARNVGLELLNPGRRLAGIQGGQTVALVIGYNCDEAVKEAIAHGADKVMVLDNEVYDHYSTDAYTAAIVECVKNNCPTTILMGASPMGMAASEQLGALSAGTIDALDQSISLMYSTKSYELVDQVTLLAQQPLADALFCSTTWWNTIPAEYQEIIEDELHQAGLRYNAYSVENEGKMRTEMEAAGVTFYEADRQAFLDMGCGDLVLKYGIGQELLDTLAEIRAGK